MISRSVLAWILLPSMIGAVLLATIVILSTERTIEHPQEAIVRDYSPTNGWKKAAPSEKGIDASYLEQAGEVIKEQHPAFVSLLVARDGYLVWERYFDGRTNFISTHDLYSASKSVLSTLIGIAIDQGYIDDVNQPISDFFPEYFALSPDSEKAGMTIKDLLTMRSGLEWTEGAPIVSLNPEVPLAHQLLNLPSNTSPGEAFNYSSADSHLLSAILTQATGESALAFAGDHLFKPLGINNRNWGQDNHGVTYGGSGLWLSTRDMASIGLLYLNEGYWEGRQILSKDWIAEATIAQVVLREIGEEVDLPQVAYGYQWWVREQGGYESYMALGYAGQYIVVVPELDLVVVISSVPRPWMSPRELRDAALIDLELIEDYVIPSATQFSE